MKSTSATACSCALAALIAIATATAAAQDDQRRRPGQKAPRQTATEPQPETSPAPEKQAQPKAGRAPQAAAPVRRRPGQAAEAAAPQPSAPAGRATAPEAAPSEGRRRPGQPGFSRPTATGERIRPGTPVGERLQFDVNRRSGLKRIPPPPVDAVYEKKIVPDRWQLTRSLGLTNYSWLDPYNQNTLKGDRPVFGQWFFQLNLISDTLVEPRRLPTPVGPQGNNGAGQHDLIGDGRQLLLAENLALGFDLYEGDTTFRPPDWEFRFAPVFNGNRAIVREDRALNIDPAKGTTRNDRQLGVQALFLDRHLRNVSSRYDFDSLRIGIQPFNADFRGFLFRDEQLGVRLFGNRANNLWQYNLAYFRRLEKDTNSGLNDLSRKLRRDDVVVADLFRQDFPTPGFTSQAVLLYNRNREGDEAAHFDRNGFLQRPASLGIEKPRNYDVGYAGLNGDGHFGRFNLTASGYLAVGRADRGVFVDRPTDISAFFLAAEASMDFDWRRVRFSFLYASGDRNPFDDKEHGFDAVFENPLFAGADTSFWIRQNVPLIGGGGVAISGRNGVLNDLRSSKDEGQSNFTNPGTILLGIGADLDLLPTLRVSGNLNEVAFATTEVVEAARQQAGISRDLGLDFSIAALWRPQFSQNIVIRASAAALVPGRAYKQLFGSEVPYSMLINLVFTY